jgi:hypothetical protein
MNHFLHIAYHNDSVFDSCSSFELFDLEKKKRYWLIPTSKYDSFEYNSLDFYSNIFESYKNLIPLDKEKFNHLLYCRIRIKNMERVIDFLEYFDLIEWGI